MNVRLSGPMIVPDNGPARRAVVLLHGYGSDGQDLISLAPFWRPLLPDALFVAPNAPGRCESNPSGYQWFAIDFNADRTLGRLRGAEAARPVIAAFLADLWAQTGISPGDTILAGFSQGAMMALDTGLLLEAPLMGIMAFSGGLIAPERVAAEAGVRPPVFLAHGDMDDVVPVEMSRGSHAALRAAGFDAELHISQGAGHTITQEGLSAAVAFISRVAGS